MFFYEQDTTSCPFGCEKRFSTEFGLDRHIQERGCEEVESVSEEVLKYSEEDCNETFPDEIGALVHMEDGHVVVDAASSSSVSCVHCDIGCSSHALQCAHLAYKDTHSNGHPTITERLGL